MFFARHVQYLRYALRPYAHMAMLAGLVGEEQQMLAAIVHAQSDEATFSV